MIFVLTIFPILLVGPFLFRILNPDYFGRVNLFDCPDALVAFLGRRILFVFTVAIWVKKQSRFILIVRGFKSRHLLNVALNVEEGPTSRHLPPLRLATTDR